MYSSKLTRISIDFCGIPNKPSEVSELCLEYPNLWLEISGLAINQVFSCCVFSYLTIHPSSGRPRTFLVYTQQKMCIYVPLKWFDGFAYMDFNLLINRYASRSSLSLHMRELVTFPITRLRAPFTPSRHHAFHIIRHFLAPHCHLPPPTSFSLSPCPQHHPTSFFRLLTCGAITIAPRHPRRAHPPPQWGRLIVANRF